ncbi:MAG TPA: ATP-dependent zinc metalloprotease FtsH [Chthoniobacterales bacterium]
MKKDAAQFQESGKRGKADPPLHPDLPPGQHLPPSWSRFIWFFLIIVALQWFWLEAAHQLTVRTIPYSEFKTMLAKGRLINATIGDSEITGKIRGNPPVAAPKKTTGEKSSPAPAATANTVKAADEKKNPQNAKTSGSQSAGKGKAPPKPASFLFRTVPVDDPNLVAEMQKAGVEFSGEHPSFLSQFLWSWIVPIAVMFFIWQFLARRLGGLRQGLMSFGSSKAKLVADKETGVTFADVAGCDEAKFELQEVVSFLKDPTRYEALGATIPKGVLLVGPPGTGKTLLARAVAGEAHVPFFLISGSDFVEMFVGVGASRVRDLFEKAKAQAPCIVFIDELDAIGRQRGVHVGAVNDEREQTLNQLLVGMDGFEANVGVIILAATNRPEVLDRALLRPGRFDRQVVVDAPDLDGRSAVLQLHVRGKPLAAGVDLRKLAAQTPGFSGADLANVTNEAALLAARRSEEKITQKDLEDAVEKVVAGPERKSRRLSDEEKRRVAFHETGHAVVAQYSKYADPVHKISIIPHGRAALGYTMQLPTADRYLISRTALIDKIKGMLGGRAAEEIVFQEISTGAENDLGHATALARQMVAVYGMSDVIGLVHCAQRQNPMLGGMVDGVLQRDCSDQTAREIDEEVKKLLEKAYAEAKSLLQQHRVQLDRVAEELLKTETLDAPAFAKLIEEKATEESADPHSSNSVLSPPR